ISEYEPWSTKRVGRHLLFNFGINATGGHKQVGQSVVVQISDACTPSDVARFNAQAGTNGDVVKVPFAVVSVKHVGVVGEVCFENVDIAVEVEVSDGDAHTSLLQTVFAERDAAFEGLLTKGAIMLVAKEPARSGIARDINIRPAVVV